jgi:hypothetical protein
MHCRGRREVLEGGHGLVGTSIRLAEAEVAVGDERFHDRFHHVLEDGVEKAACSVEPFKSAKSTVTCLRSPSRAACVPHFDQR